MSVLSLAFVLPFAFPSLLLSPPVLPLFLALVP